MSESVIVTGKDLAARIGCRPSYVVELKRQGRLVPAPDGRGYCLAESLALYEATRDPSRVGVAERHAEARGRATAAADGGGPPVGGEGAAEDDVDDDKPVRGVHAERRAQALADKEEALAAAAIRDNRLRDGELMEARDVEAAVASAASALRKELEQLPDALAPQVAPLSDEHAIRSLIAEAIDTALREVARKFTAISKAHEQSRGGA